MGEEGAFRVNGGRDGSGGWIIGRDDPVGAGGGDEQGCEAWVGGEEALRGERMVDSVAGPCVHGTKNVIFESYDFRWWRCNLLD